jgi:hypothetical protein
MRRLLSRCSAAILRANPRTVLPWVAGVAVLSLTGAAVAGNAGEPTVTSEAPAPVVVVERAPVAPDAEPDITAAQPAVEDEGTPSDPAPVAPAEDAAVAVTAPPAAPAPAPAPDEHRIPLAPVPAGQEAFAGLSTWIDIYDTEWTPEQQVDIAAAAGVDTVFVQSARHKSVEDIEDPARLAGVIDAAKARGIHVMTWYIPDFTDPVRDLRRAQAAIAFTTSAGNRPDAFGLDIELDDLPDVGLRNRRLLEMSAALRAWTGPDYPLAAVVLPPLQLDLNGTWWPGFPYAELRPFYDVYIPMSYSSYRGTDAAKTHQWNLDNVLETRRRAGDPDLPVHLAGGIADNLPEVTAFVDAARDGNVTGAGLYDLHTTRASAWPALQALRRTTGTAGPVPSLLSD